jgi:PKD repeat protein
VAGPGCQTEDSVVAPALGATCEARPPSGEAPLAVSFVLGISGAEGSFTVRISYGDGTTGTNPDLPHTYATAGSYTASFEVATATQSARCGSAISLPSRCSSRPPTR